MANIVIKIGKNKDFKFKFATLITESSKPFPHKFISFLLAKANFDISECVPSCIIIDMPSA